jgi:hypothetical protein
LTAAQVASLSSFRSERRLSALLRGYDDLDTPFVAADHAVVRLGSVHDVAAWRSAMVALLEANLGAATMRAIFTLSERWSSRPIAELVMIAEALHEIGREAGSSATRAILDVLPACLLHVPQSSDLRRVFAALTQLARQAPESVGVVAGRLNSLLQNLDAAGFELWLTGGLRTCGANVQRRRTYFALDDPLASLPAENDFARLEHRLSMGLAVLWDRRPLLRVVRARRATLVGGVLGFPDRFTGVTEVAADRLYWASMAHAGAHLALSTQQFPVGKLKPLQVVLVSLIEDARVERLAIQAMPGLSRLWRPYHVAQPSGHATAADLLARLSRALIDPSYDDDHGWVEKGRSLFAAATPRLGDPAISREIGGLLGNDIGQMRLQFNPRTYVIEPAYRDDNMGLWDFGDRNGELVDEIDIGAESARVEQKQGDDGKPDNQIDPDSPRARPQQSVASDGILIAHYPEWDYELGRARPNWVTVRESEPDLPRTPMGMTATSEADAVARKVTAIARGATIGRRIREKRQIEGEMLDIDASIAAMIERRGKQPPDIRVFQREIPGPRELSLLLLLDMSQSTADKGRDGRSVIAVERDAAAILGAAFDAAADSLAIHGFNSDTREKVRYVKFKDFTEPMDAVVAARLRAMASAHSTRLGAAMRHAGTYLQQRRSFRRVLLVLTDGEPSDIDVQDPRYLVEDARQAALALRRTGIDVLSFGLGQGSFQALDRIVGHKRSLRVPRIDTLPERVMQLYAQLKT